MADFLQGEWDWMNDPNFGDLSDAYKLTNPFPSLPGFPTLPTFPTTTSTPTTTAAPSGGFSFLNNLFSNQTATGLPRTAEQAGALALLGYAMRPQEDITAPSIYDLRSPYGTSAVDYLQGVYQAPPDPFAPGGLYSKYLPAFEQSEKDLFNNTQQSIIAGLPQSASTAMGGSELAAIREAFLTRALPQRLSLQADLMRETLNRQLGAAGTVYGGEGNLQSQAFQGEVNAAMMNAATESQRNQALAQLGTALLLAGRGGPGGTGTTGTGTGVPGTGQPGTGGSIGDAIRRSLGGGTGNQGQYAPIGQLSVTDIIGQMQAGTLSTQEGLALLARTALLPALGTAAAGYGAGQLGAQLGQNQFQATALGGAGGAAAGALIGSMTPLGPIGTAIGAIVGGLTGLFSERGQQQDIKETFRQSDLDSQADQVQEIGSFFTQRLGSLGIDTSGFQQFISQMIAGSESGAGAYSYGGISGTADQQQAVADVGGKLLLQALQQANPSITSLNDVPGLEDEFIDYLTGSTFSAENSSYAGGPALNQFQPWWEAGLAEGGRLPLGGEFLVGERGPELLRAAPGTEVLPMQRGTDGSFALDPTALARNVVPPGVFLPDVSRSFEGPPNPIQALLARQQTPLFQNSYAAANANLPYPTPPGQSLIGSFDPRAMTPGAIPALLASLRASGGYPGQGNAGSPATAPLRPVFSPPTGGRPSYAGRPAFAGTRPTGTLGQSLLARTLQPIRSQRRRRPNAPAKV